MYAPEPETRVVVNACRLAALVNVSIVCLASGVFGISSSKLGKG